jgi:AraC-like DNA-binding protein
MPELCEKNRPMDIRTAARIATDEVGELQTQSTYRQSPLNYVQTSPGPLGADVHRVFTPRVDVRETTFEAGVILTTVGSFDRFAVGALVAGGTWMNGTQLENNNIGVVASSTPGTIIRISRQARWCNTTIDSAFFSSVASIHGYAVPAADCSQQIPQEVQASLVRWMSRVARTRVTTAISDAQFEDSITLSLLRVLNFSRIFRTPRPNQRKEIVRQCIDYMRAHYSTDLTITGVCSVVNASERTVRYAFGDLLGMTPKQYLENYRLHRAMQLIRSGDANSIAEAAYACGFRHLGRFAQSFKQAFGALPSQVQP